ncbi:3-oxo-tetronate kinase [Streptomyces pinistramenti]|uniref:3-oxo-tetronate kinase n=1 Tax=Streptomyces pinistramenti TaxID=2884812 RepID=UPI001D087F83|nr:3-oxo-tetronate kinase [Streptomyces pinistramenti]MCB5906535.1 four-carbon acid sugar kinase family protein [Streptomyces pinistramenti]
MIGVIADDFTGATDVAVAFRRAGLRCLIAFGTPAADRAAAPHDVLIVALKSRTTPRAQAVNDSLGALTWLTAQGAGQIYFKFCSTFDSTPDGNIGPVLDALAGQLDAPTVLLTPSSPEHGRTQYLGTLFVGEQPLSETPMRHHPLTPMTDSRLVRVLQRQTTRPVALVPHPAVRRGADEIRRRAARRGRGYLLVDAIDTDDLNEIGRAVADHPLVAGAAGLAGGIAAAVADSLAGATGSRPAVDDTDPVGDAPAAVLTGSCSARTLEQIAAHRSAGRPTYRLDALADHDPAALARTALAWYDTQPSAPAPLFHSSLPPEELRAVQDALGVQESAALLEDALGRIAVGLVERGVRRIVAAGGETSGAIVTALGITGGEIGPEAATGVPWIYGPGSHPRTHEPFALLLKSGNFGEPDLFLRATPAPTGDPTGDPE